MSSTENMQLTVGALRKILADFNLSDDTPIILPRTNADNVDEVYGFRIASTVGTMYCPYESPQNALLIATSDIGQDAYGLITNQWFYHGDPSIDCTKVWF